MYITLHCHKVDDDTLVEDGTKPVHIPSGWEIARADDAHEILVCAAHPWQSRFLIFSNGDMYGTALASSFWIGTTRSPSKKLIFLTPENRGKSGQRLSYSEQARSERRERLF
jgi:hypothetical protein